ncbi:MAG: NAD(P)/FAD-dependent oxidoreductase [Acidobacteria bacterium]|jgi:thioredoxin reductase|nr:NAD(P)/FAD-dependent oxidoreductase [Acidobacteriota bacterium]
MNSNIAIIGGGPAGVSAAIQLKRFDITAQMFEKNRIGGLLWNAHRIENYPAFPEGISGAGLAIRFKNHLEMFRIPVNTNAVTSLDFYPGQDRFLLATSEGTYTADFVIVASGTEPRTTDIMDIIPAELSQYVNFEIFPLLGLTGKKIVIVGSGDIAFDYALHLSKFHGNDIKLICRSEDIKALPLLFRRVHNIPYIKMINSAVLQKVEKGDACPLRLAFEKKGTLLNLDADFLVCAIGRNPQTSFYTPHLREKEKQLIDEGRLYLAGDVKNGRSRQTVIAAGNGVDAAVKIYEYLPRGNR